MVRMTLAASPRRSRILVAKATMVGAVTFVAGAVGTAAAIPIGTSLSKAHGIFVFPVSSSTQLRVVLGAAALLAVAAIMAMAVGAIFRHSAGAVTTVTVAVVLPYALTVIPFMPAGAATWLSKVTPGAAFAVQQTLTHHQVASNYTPYYGYYPLQPWAGLAVLAGYAVVAPAVAAALLARRDA
ncbi:hypothetical protein ACFVW8_38330 [Streptomyces sp. NPDC058221]|uniref:hypothetical protein n=1 Tax=Streptomyces sp. NPDC058221 TaxID=3346388 RepID=UPI0036EEF397